MSKYAPANSVGDKPYVVSFMRWGRSGSKVVYASSPAEARYVALGRKGVGEYVTGCRRALATEVTA